MQIAPGLEGTAELVVGEEHTAPRIGSGRVHVLATPVMINLIEAAALAAVTFRVEAHDEKDLIGHGTHERVVVNVAKFDQRVERKRV
ncbi:MAG: thioesterase [Burkholderiales bacterium]|nr:thioesterase [Burkholderiales bacterium]